MSTTKLIIVLVILIQLSMIAFVVFFDRENPNFVKLDDGSVLDLQGKTKVIFWHAMGGRLGKVMKEMVQRFNQLPDNEYYIKAQYMGKYESLRQKLIASLISDTTPHCAQVYEAWMAKMIRGDVVLPLDDFIAEEGPEFTADLIPVMLRNIQFKDHIWSLPFNKSMPICYYNKDLFREVGLDPDHFPETWDEFLRACQKLTRDLDGDGINETWGFAFGPNPWIFECLLYQAGGKMLNAEKTKVLLDSREGLDSLKFMLDLLYKYEVAYRTQGYENQADYVAKKVGIVQGSSVSKIYLEDKITFDWGMAPLPGRDRKAAVLSGTNVILFAGKPKHETRGAWKFVKWFTSAEQTAYWSRHTTYMPVRKSAVKLLSDYLAQPLSTRHAIDQLAVAEFEPRIAAWFKCRDILGKTMEKAIIQEENWMKAGNPARPERYLVPMTEEMNKILYYEQ